MDIEDVVAAGGNQRVFRAKYKINQPGFISHITQRAAGKEPLFLEKGDYLHFLALLKESASRFELGYYAFCLMPNHVHLLVEPHKPNLDSGMHSLFFRYATFFNRKYQRRGHLFGGRYRQALCLAPDYLLTASVYIHLNPVRAGLTKRASDYPWSSAAVYCRQAEQDSFLLPERICTLVAADPDEARQVYARLLHQGRADAPENAQEQPGVIEKFCDRLGARFPKLFGRLQSKRVLPHDTSMPLQGSPSLEQLLAQFPTGSARRPETRQAKKYVLEQLEARGFPRKEIAERLGIAPKTVYNLLHS
ncbi:transposase [Desulfohalobium retbaense]|uniref:Transposase IS200-like domain-containing protein n=1 Tax=Desulfohalobium retbaense (strain ATCC 49708 / DSM 5692 / JCM 16813 / HR100) TaxID=485915 RepID=C8X070_DESRD|nr:transposase [Desulfohalobium retbaense]ACV67695.1 protein of unknown function DUF1568 [Desulfohalobium retbaense DSM 5692]